MTKVRIEDASLGDAIYVAEHLRPSDMSELMAAHGDDVSPVAVMTQAWERAAACKVALDDENEPIMVFGVNPMTDGVGVPWLLGTDRMGAVQHLLVRDMTGFMDQAHEMFHTLVNRVDARQRKTIKWLKHLGFEIGDEVPEGPYDMPFRYFRSVRNV